tara:strand:+ start:33 stop:197 length:165 start_codon:yes stop_codon:yes gene_type:complete
LIRIQLVKKQGVGVMKEEKEKQGVMKEEIIEAVVQVEIEEQEVGVMEEDNIRIG